VAAERPEQQGFFAELGQYLRGARWLKIPLIVLLILVIAILIFGSLGALPFVYDAF
jgi:hypothetical protein